MSTEMDIDLALDLDRKDEVQLKASLPKGYIAVSGDEDGGARVHLLIRRAGDDAQTVSTTAGALVLDFLQGLSQLKDTVRRVGGELRLGIYYDVNEAVVFPLRLSAECVGVMAGFNLSLDSTGYPSSEEESP